MRMGVNHKMSSILDVSLPMRAAVTPEQNGTAGIMIYLGEIVEWTTTNGKEESERHAVTFATCMH